MIKHVKLCKIHKDDTLYLKHIKMILLSLDKRSIYEIHKDDTLYIKYI